MSSMLDSIKRAQDYYEEVHRYHDQMWKSDQIRKVLREQGLVVLRTPTTADQLKCDLHESLDVIDRSDQWLLPYLTSCLDKRR